MTNDKRFVLKQMLDAWTGSERDSMLAFSSDYFRYFLKQSDQRPSLIAKLFGVFSIKIKNDKTGDEQKLDLVIMENLFHAHAVSHIFDLKGIAARVSKGEEEPNSVMWDVRDLLFLATFFSLNESYSTPGCQSTQMWSWSTLFRKPSLPLPLPMILLGWLNAVSWTILPCSASLKRNTH
jgi:hypothetical protein